MPPTPPAIYTHANPAAWHGVAEIEPVFVQEYGKDLFITCTTNNPAASGRSVRLSAANGCGALDNGVSKTNPLLILPLGTMYLVMKNADIFVESKVLKC